MTILGKSRFGKYDRFTSMTIKRASEGCSECSLRWGKLLSVLCPFISTSTKYSREIAAIRLTRANSRIRNNRLVLTSSFPFCCCSDPFLTLESGILALDCLIRQYSRPSGDYISCLSLIIIFQQSSTVHNSSDIDPKGLVPSDKGLQAWAAKT